MPGNFFRAAPRRQELSETGMPAPVSAASRPDPDLIWLWSGPDLDLAWMCSGPGSSLDLEQAENRTFAE